MYSSTIQILENLYPKLSSGGYCIIDDYGMIPNCRKEVDDYREAHNITEKIISIDEEGCTGKIEVESPYRLIRLYF